MDRSERDSQFITLYKEGKTLKEIGDMFGVSKQYVGQITKGHGISAKDGGLVVRLSKKHCKADGCFIKGRYQKGYCPKHAARIKAHGDPTIVHGGNRDHPDKCMVYGCDSPYKSKGMCYNHYMSFTAFARRGNPMSLNEYLELKRKQAEAKNGSL